MPHLFAIYLGGRATGCNTELHDVIFTVGKDLKDCKPQIIEKWFGNKDRLHVDSYIQLDKVDGHTVELSKTPSENNLKLYFINLGAYQKGLFTEIHENRLYVCQDKMQAKQRAKEELCQGMYQVHTDDLFEVDDLIEIEKVSGYYLNLTPKAGAKAPEPINGWLALERI
jgi:hypothetical protein